MQQSEQKRPLFDGMRAKALAKMLAKFWQHITLQMGDKRDDRGRAGTNSHPRNRTPNSLRTHTRAVPALIMPRLNNMQHVKSPFLTKATGMRGMGELRQGGRGLEVEGFW